MKLIWSILIFVLMLGISNSEVIFSDDFSSGNDSQWTKPEGGSWVVIDTLGEKEYHKGKDLYDGDYMKSQGHYSSFINDSNLTNYTIDVDAKVVDDIGGGLGCIMFRINNIGKDYYFYGIEPSVDRAYFSKRYNYSQVSFDQITSTATSLTTWYNLKVIVYNDSFYGYLNGVATDTLHDTSYKSGGAGLIAMYAHCHYDNFSIKSIEKVILNHVEDTIAEKRPQFRWLSFEDASQYELQIDTVNNFRSPLISVNLSDTTYNLASDLPLKKIYWRVNTGFAHSLSDVDSFLVRINPPLFVSTPDTIAVQGSLYNYLVKWLDPDGLSARCSLITHISHMYLINDSLKFTPDTAQVGIHSITISVTNSVGVSTIQTFRIHVIPREPSIFSKPNSIIDQGFRYSYNIQWTDPAGFNATCSLLTAISNMQINNDTLSFVPDTNQIGSHNVSIMVKNSKGASAIQTFRIVVLALKPPVITSTPDTVVYQGRSYAYIIKWTDPDGLAAACSLITTIPNMVLKKDTLYFTPDTNQIGVLPVRMAVINSKRAITYQTFNLNVLLRVQAITFKQLIPPRDTTIKETDTLRFKVDAVDADTSVDLYYAWYINQKLLSRLPNCMLITNYMSAGICTVKVTVFNGEEFKDNTWLINVLNSPLAPIIIGPDDGVQVDGATLLKWRNQDPELVAASLMYEVQFLKGTKVDSVLCIADSIKDTSVAINKIVKSGILPKNRVIYWKVASKDGSGHVTPFSPVRTFFYQGDTIGIETMAMGIPVSYELYQNVPNPFNPSTVIRFGIPATEKTGDGLGLAIYSVSGSLVRDYTLKSITAGYHVINWDAKNNSGVSCPTGIYICKLHMGNRTLSRRMLLVK